MKNKIIKLDRQFLKLLTTFTQKWIKKHKYTKHKVDLTIQIQTIRLCGLTVLALIVPSMFYFLAGQFIQGGFHAAVWSIAVGMSYVSLQKLITKSKPEHDLLFSTRKNPHVYNIEKEVLKYVFETGRKKRLAFLLLDFVMSFFFCTLGFILFFLSINPILWLCMGIYWFVSPFLTQIEMYMFYVFDFDPPTPKKKKLKASLTELVAKSWQDFVGGFLPAPTPNFT